MPSLRHATDILPLAVLLLVLLVAYACAPLAQSPPEPSAAVAVAPADGSVASHDCDPLLSALERRPGPPRPITRLDRLALDHGQACVAELREALLHAESDLARGQAASVLALIAGGDVAPVLREMAPAGPLLLQIAAVRAAMERAEKEDVDFLVSALQRWEAANRREFHRVQAAAASLGILREERARPMLEALLGEPGAISTVAAFALESLDRPACLRNLPRNASDETLAVLVLDCGVPRVNDQGRLRQGRTTLIWERHADGWRTRESAAGAEELDELPTLSYNVARTADGGRAIVDIGLGLGPRTGWGYRYILRYEEDLGAWRLVQVEPTWVA